MVQERPIHLYKIGVKLSFRRVFEEESPTATTWRFLTPKTPFGMTLPG
jgi:hypothetical protein